MRDDVRQAFHDPTMLAVEPDGRRAGQATRSLVQLVLAPLAIGVLAGLRLVPLGSLTAAGLGYVTFACAQVAVTVWLLAAERAG
jgi:hypothetical protein